MTPAAPMQGPPKKTDDKSFFDVSNLFFIFNKKEYKIFFLERSLKMTIIFNSFLKPFFEKKELEITHVSTKCKQQFILHYSYAQIGGPTIFAQVTQQRHKNGSRRFKRACSSASVLI